jgi:hypothetical protein
MNDKTKNNRLAGMRCAATCFTMWAAFAFWSVPCAAQLSTTEQLQQLQSRYDEMVSEFIAQVQRLPDDPELFSSLPAKAELLQSGELLKLTNELTEAKKLITSREDEINKSSLSVQDKSELKTALVAQRKPLDALSSKAAGFKTALTDLKDNKLKGWKEVYDSFLSISGPEKARERLRSAVNEFCKPYAPPKTSAASTPTPAATPAQLGFAPTPSPAGPAPPEPHDENAGWGSMGWVNTIAEKASGFFGARSNSPQPPVGSKVLRFDDALRRANQGDAYAQAVVSIYYSTGYLTERNPSKAYEYARKSAEQNHPLGLYRLGAIVQSGEGVPASRDEGIQLKRLSFDGLNSMSGDPYAMTALGIMVFRGENTRPNIAEAARLYKLAADQGYGPAQYLYSACCVAGHGIPKNPKQAEKYWRMAYDQNYPPALEGLPR